jgi:predicted transposase YdaD
MQLAIASETTLTNQARSIIDRVQRELISPSEKQAIIEVVTTIAVYKFSRLSREEVEAMLGLRLEDTRIYQEAKEEGRMEILATTIPLLLEAGLTIEQIAQQLKVEVELVQQMSKPL